MVSGKSQMAALTGNRFEISCIAYKLQCKYFRFRGRYHGFSNSGFFLFDRTTWPPFLLNKDISFGISFLSYLQTEIYVFQLRFLPYSSITFSLTTLPLFLAGPLKMHLECLSVALYAAETWTLTETLRKKLETCESWVWSKMLKISWTEKIMNEEVRKRIGEKHPS